MITLRKLIEELEKRGSYYFSEETLRFFGERLSDMHVLKETVTIRDDQGVARECYVLSKVSKGWDGKRFRNYDYFDIETLERVKNERL